MWFLYAQFCFLNETDSRGFQNSLPASYARLASNQKENAYTVLGHLHLFHLLLRIPR